MYDGSMTKRNENFDEASLRDVAGMTELMRVREREVRAIAEKRTAAARRHQEAGVTYRQLATAMNLTEVAVYKLLCGRDGSIRERKAANKTD